tara:strand:- start:1516 stop:2556 length:1041 start_codon:yes stop_codon:yes gene_type:complete
MTPTKRVQSARLIRGYQKDHPGDNEMAKPKLKDQRPDYEIDNEEIAHRMRQAVENCEEYGTTEIAQFCKVNRTLVYEWMRAGGSRPSVENMTKFCKAVGVDFEWILFGVEPDQFLEPIDTAELLEFKNIKAFRQKNKPDVKDPEESGGLVTVFIPNIEPDDIGQGEIKDVDDIEAQINSWITDPIGKGMSITLMEDALDAIGIPRFCAQVIYPNFKPFHEQGTVLGFATDIVPSRGDFTMLAVKKNHWDFWRVVSGFFYPVDARLATNNMAADFYENHQCVMTSSMTEVRVDDVHVNTENGDEMKLIGVATFKSEWLTGMLKQKFTSLPQRRELAWNKRARIPENE